MREEYNSILSTLTEPAKINHFGRYWYIGETQISARCIGLSLILDAIFMSHLSWISDWSLTLLHSHLVIKDFCGGSIAELTL